MKPKALVTGATGFIGGHLARRLLQEGWPVRLLVREPGRLPAELRAGCDVVAADLRSAPSLSAAVRGVDVVFHCAANVRTWDAWPAYFDVNVAGVRNLLDAIAREGRGLARFVHFSTVDVYGFPRCACDEACPTPPSPFGYGETKRQGEAVVRELCARAAIPFCILRPANVIGPGSQFIHRIGTALRSGVMLTIDGGRANAGLLQVENLAQWAIWAACAPAAAGATYNVRDGFDATWKEFIVALRSGIRGRGIVVDLPFAVGDGIGAAMEAAHRALLPAREPVLHRLLVRIFGRTCGHSASRLHADSGTCGAASLDRAMPRSVEWFLAHVRA